MRDDLLEAEAAVDWAVAQFDPLKARLVSWFEKPPYSTIVEPRPEIGKNFHRLRDVRMPPPIINAEVGAIINSIRSSLDILVNQLAERADHPASKGTHFPISASRDDFLHGKHAGRKAIKGLTTSDQTIIENLEPWRGGNNLLVALHDLDIMRKHRRLIGVSIEPQLALINFVTGSRRNPGMRFDIFPSTRFENDAIVAQTPIGPEYGNVQLAVDVTFNEIGPASGGAVITALENFASLAYSIIKLFDT